VEVLVYLVQGLFANRQFRRFAVGTLIFAVAFLLGVAVNGLLFRLATLTVSERSELEQTVVLNAEEGPCRNWDGIEIQAYNVPRYFVGSNMRYYLLTNHGQETIRFEVNGSGYPAGVEYEPVELQEIQIQKFQQDSYYSVWKRDVHLKPGEWDLITTPDATKPFKIKMKYLRGEAGIERQLVAAFDGIHPLPLSCR
jgi:hypothetical protein